MSKTNRVLSSTVAIMIAILVTIPGRPAHAQGVNLAQLAAEVQSLQSQVQSLQTTVNSQAATIQALQAKTAPISVQNGIGANTELYFTGVNVHIVNGLGATDGNPNDPILGVFDNDAVTNGLGNLIIGYNASAALLGFTQTRTGSHNLILGDGNSYSSYGSIIGGLLNTASAPDASIITGDVNTASGVLSTVTGGQTNAASGPFSVATGGQDNTSSSQDSVVTGGSDNTASNQDAVVTGGQSNFANAPDSIVLGGTSNTAGALFSVVTGGNGNTATTIDSIAP